LTQADLDKLNASHLIGTPALKAYMHGYFMELKAYQKLISAVNPFAYEEYKKKEVAKKLLEQQEKRINIKQKKATVNVDYVRELEKRTKDALTKKNKKSGYQAKEALADSRFGQMFEDADFTIDKKSENYKAIKTTEANESDNEDDKGEDEEIKNIYKPRTPNLNNLFSGKDEDNDSVEEDSDDVKNFETKMKKDKKRPKSDKIIKNYGDINKKMKEKGE
jgi:ribosome biogenesis protein ENP2